MSHRVGNGALIASAQVVSSNGALGVLAENIPSTGTHGAGYAYASLTLPADNGKEIRGLITTAAAVVSGSGTLTSFFAYEDTSFDIVVTDDCVVEWTWSLYVDGVLETAGLTGSVTMVLVLNETRMATMGHARPWQRAKYPVANKDQQWRVDVGNAYGVNLAGDAGVTILRRRLMARTA